jgi:hypothetical protein
LQKLCQLNPICIKQFYKIHKADGVEM